MLHYRRIQREELVPAKITCNKCGKTFDAPDYYPGAACTTIVKLYPYGSKKDGDKYISHICEPCMDEIYATFVIPPQIVGTSVWGEEPSNPVVCEEPPLSEKEQSVVKLLADGPLSIAEVVSKLGEGPEARAIVRQMIDARTIRLNSDMHLETVL